ncbi:MAG TPA: hypothetical protein DCZ05_03190 [Deltaproteobacteria bacterium]|nr:hypothetical protein [Deltaproteobacteria bacterium]
MRSPANYEKPSCCRSPMLSTRSSIPEMTMLCYVPATSFGGLTCVGDSGIGSFLKNLEEGVGRFLMDRKRFVLPLLLSVLFILVTTLSAAALEVGEKAPDFELDSTKGGKLKLSSLRGKNVLINFYVLDFSPT